MNVFAPYNSIFCTSSKTFVQKNQNPKARKFLLINFKDQYTKGETDRAARSLNPAAN